ncbi:MAG: polymer-forming cytoskeletal protein [Dehalobacterium sp.]
MFSRKESGMDSQVDTLIGNKVTVQGTLNGEGNLRIDGKVEGEIILNGDLFVGKTGLVNANIKGHNAIVAGEVNGNFNLSGKLELTETAKMAGDIEMDTLVIHEGAEFRGYSNKARETMDKSSYTDK